MLQSEIRFLGQWQFDTAALKSFRARSKLTQSQVAGHLGLKTPDVIRRWENGQAQPRADLLLKIMVLYRISNPQQLLSIPTEQP
jgi:transcriptional regulator with XRE-family HTH domain